MFDVFGVEGSPGLPGFAGEETGFELGYPTSWFKGPVDALSRQRGMRDLLSLISTLTLGAAPPSPPAREGRGGSQVPWDARIGVYSRCVCVSQGFKHNDLREPVKVQKKDGLALIRDLADELHKMMDSKMQSVLVSKFFILQSSESKIFCFLTFR